LAEEGTRSAAEANLLRKLRERAATSHGGSLRATVRFSVAAELWFGQISEMVLDGRPRRARAMHTAASSTTTS
jgi:hypothetical protein